jgi:hypothetical protein
LPDAALVSTVGVNLEGVRNAAFRQFVGKRLRRHPDVRKLLEGAVVQINAAKLCQVPAVLLDEIERQVCPPPGICVFIAFTARMIFQRAIASYISAQIA